MSYDSFTFAQVKKTFKLTTEEGKSFLPSHLSSAPSTLLEQTLAENVPLAIAIGNEKARSELIIAPILVELRKKLLRQIALFSGASFDVDYALGLNGIVDFLISRNPEQYAIEAPILVLVEAKRADLNFGMGQVIAEMVAAQIFNLEEQQNIERVFGCISNGMQWRFLCLEQKSLHIEPIDIDLYPIDRLLGILKWAIET